MTTVEASKICLALYLRSSQAAIRELHSGLSDWLETVRTDDFEIGPVDLRRAQIEEFLELLGQRIDWNDGGQAEHYNLLQQSLNLLANPNWSLEELEPWLRALQMIFVRYQVERISAGNQRAQALKKKGYYHWLESVEYATTLSLAERLASEIRLSCGLPPYRKWER